MSKKSLESIIARYNELQPLEGSAITPRVGFYYVQSVFENAKYLTMYKARVLWKETQDEAFNFYAQFEIQLTSLKETFGDPENFDPESLVGKVVRISSTNLSVILFKGKETPIVVCNWNIDNSPVIFDKPSLLDLLPDDADIQSIVKQFDCEDIDDAYYGDDGFGDDGFDFGFDDDQHS